MNWLFLIPTIFFGLLLLGSALVIFGPEIADLPPTYETLNLTRSSFNATSLAGVFQHFNPETREVELYIVHDTTTVTTQAVTSCCTYYGGGIHWRTRNIPMKVYQSSVIKTYMEEIDSTWALLTAIDLVGPVMLSNLPYTENEISFSKSNGVNTVGIKTIVGDFADALAIARLTIGGDGQHYTHCAIIVNAAITNICDATHTSSCYDLKSILNHEYGHLFGMMDEYSSDCADYLMYGSMSTGNIRKRSVDTLTQQCGIQLYNGLSVEGEGEQEEDQTSSASRLSFWPKKAWDKLAHGFL